MNTRRFVVFVAAPQEQFGKFVAELANCRRYVTLTSSGRSAPGREEDRSQSVQVSLVTGERFFEISHENLARAERLAGTGLLQPQSSALHACAVHTRSTSRALYHIIVELRWKTKCCMLAFIQNWAGLIICRIKA